MRCTVFKAGWWLKSIFHRSWYCFALAALHVWSYVVMERFVYKLGVLVLFELGGVL